MPLLGLDVPRVAVDALFDQFDPDGSGNIDFKELQKMLRTSGASQKSLAGFKAAGNTVRKSVVGTSAVRKQSVAGVKNLAQLGSESGSSMASVSEA